MSIKTIQDILPLVEKPSRYLGSEINIIKKDLSKVALRFALVFPDLYEIGTSHFGMQIRGAGSAKENEETVCILERPCLQMR